MKHCKIINSNEPLQQLKVELISNMSKNPQKKKNTNLNAHEKTIVISKTQQNWNAHCELYANCKKHERPKMYATN